MTAVHQHGKDSIVAYTSQLLQLSTHSLDVENTAVVWDGIRLKRIGFEYSVAEISEYAYLNNIQIFCSNFEMV